MADKSIGELKKATALYDTSLLPMEQDGEAQALSGALLRKFAEEAGDAAGRAAVTDEVEQAAAHAAAAAQAQQGAKTSETNAKTSETAAAGSATKAAQSEKNAAQSATTAQQYSGKPPQPIDGTWWIWDAATGSYKDSGVSSILRIVKSYTSIEAMEADYGNMQDNDLVIIATDVELEDNSKLYIHTPTGWRYLSDLSGIQGPPGRSAYEVALDGGYTGSEVEFWQDLTEFKTLSEQAVAAAAAAGESERNAQTSKTNAQNSETAANESAANAAESEAAAKTAEDNAKTAQAAAEKARDEAQAIVGSDFLERPIYDPQGKRQDIFKYVDDALGNVPSPESDVFIAKRDVATWDEVIEAINAGKVVIGLSGTSYYTLAAVESTAVRFTRAYSNTIGNLAITSAGKWSANVSYLATDAEVTNAIQNAIGDAIGGSY